MIEPDRNFIRLLAALDGFKERHGNWPPRVVVESRTLERLHEFLGDRFMREVQRKVELAAGPAGFRAEGNGGAYYDYGKEGFPDSRPTPSAQEWLDLPLDQVWKEWLDRRSE